MCAWSCRCVARVGSCDSVGLVTRISTCADADRARCDGLVERQWVRVRRGRGRRVGDVPRRLGALRTGAVGRRRARGYSVPGDHSDGRAVSARPREGSPTTRWMARVLDVRRHAERRTPRLLGARRPTPRAVTGDQARSWITGRAPVGLRRASSRCRGRHKARRPSPRKRPSVTRRRRRCARRRPRLGRRAFSVGRGRRASSAGRRRTCLRGATAGRRRGSSRRRAPGRSP